MAEEILAGDGIEAQGGVVEDDYLGVMAQGQEQGESAVLTFGKGLDFGFAGEFEQVHKAVGGLVIPGGIEAGDPFDDLADAHPAVHVLILGHVTDESSDGDGVGLGV